MIKIQKIALTRFYLEEHFQFMNDMDSIWTEWQSKLTTTRTTVNVFGLYPRFKDLLTQEDAAVTALRKNIHTRSVTDYDNLRDKIYVGLKNFFKSYTYNVSVEKEEAAHRVLIIIENYKDPRRRPYNEETAILTNMIQDLRNKCGDDLDIIGEAAHAWISELETANREFETAMSTRYDDKMETSNIEISKIRTEINEVYSQMTVLIDVENSLAQNENYINMAMQMNERIRYYKNTLAMRKGRSEAKKDKEE